MSELLRHEIEVENENGETETQTIELSGNTDTEAPVIVGEGAYSPQMHGRRQIFTNELYITDSNVISVLNKAMDIHRKNRREEEFLEKYMRGIQPVLDRVKKYNTEINNKIVVNIANQIVTFKTSEFAGEPIQYISRGNNPGAPELVAKLNSMMLSECKQSKDMQLAHRMYCAGVGYRLVIHDQNSSGDAFDEAPFEIYIPDPKNTFVVRANDVSRRVVMGVTYVYMDDTYASDRVRYTVYTDNVTYVIEGNSMGGQRIVDRKVHNFGMVTLIEYPCNADYIGAFEVVLPLLDAYNLAESNRLDAIENFVQAVMVFEGVNIKREDFLAMKDLGALCVPEKVSGTGGRSVYYLNEQLDQGQTQTLINDMYQTILQIVGMPSQGNANTSDSSNNGAVIMKNGWWNAEARALETEAMWKASETEFLKVALRICEQTNKLTGLRLSDLEPRFGRRSYEDLLVKTQSFQSLINSRVPAIQAFTFSKLSKDPESDAIVYNAYQEELAKTLDELNGVTDNTGYHRWRENSSTDGNSTEAPVDGQYGG